jgi:hypothetical protein
MTGKPSGSRCIVLAQLEVVMMLDWSEPPGQTGAAWRVEAVRRQQSALG